MNSNPYKDKIHIGEIYTYKQLCEIFDEQYKSGEAKKAQVRMWNRHFKWEYPINKKTKKPSKKFKIIEIYDTPLKKKINHKKRIKNDYEIMDDYVILHIYKDKDYEVFIDKDDFEKVSQYSWNIDHKHVIAHDNYQRIYIHRLVMCMDNLNRKISPYDMIVHHINCNPLDNRKNNLQVMTQLEHTRLHNGSNKDMINGKSWDEWLELLF